MSGVNLKPVIFSGIAFAVISQVIHTIGALLSMSYYFDPNYFAVWSKLMMPAAGPPPPEFFIASVSFSFVVGAIFAYIYGLIKKSIAGKTAIEKGLKFGLILFLLGTLPGMISLYLLINLPLALIVMWTIEGLVVSLLAGIAIARISG
jgi:hypothetical protein